MGKNLELLIILFEGVSQLQIIERNQSVTTICNEIVIIYFSWSYEVKNQPCSDRDVIYVQAALVIRGGYVPWKYRGYQNREFWNRDE